MGGDRYTDRGRKRERDDGDHGRRHHRSGSGRHSRRRSRSRSRSRSRERAHSSRDRKRSRPDGAGGAHGVRADGGSRGGTHRDTGDSSRRSSRGSSSNGGGAGSSDGREAMRRKVARLEAWKRMSASESAPSATGERPGASDSAGPPAAPPRRGPPPPLRSARAIEREREREREREAERARAAEGAEEIDPLDAFMMGVTQEVKQIRAQDQQRSGARGEIVDDEEDDFLETAKDPAEAAAAAKKKKRKDMLEVDHSAMDYEPFRRKFYIASPEIAKMDDEEVREYRKDLGSIKIHGKDCPRPVKKFSQCGLPTKVLDKLRSMEFTTPTPIQCQAIPAVMSGRNVIGVARTGSGKTLAFVLPMLRHIVDQRPLRMGEGPIALIMAPTRELAVQIRADTNTFARGLGLRTVCVYGGSGVGGQISALKRGAEIVVCTPGRMIDVLASGRVTNLARVTYVVLDEADRMFDLGFTPQIMSILNGVRPGRQICLFSATFPRTVESLAKKALPDPVTIIVGQRSVVCADVDQRIVVLEEERKFHQLLGVLGEHYDSGSILIFVDRQKAADDLMKPLMDKGYTGFSLHGGMEQEDRDSVLADFKSGAIQLLIATSVAARGLDVKGLKVVVNYNVPNHYEDYVHRVGRTGRAGNKGTAYTFITPDEEHMAQDLVRALKASKAAVPDDLQTLASEHLAKKKAGASVKTHHSGFGGKGFSFSADEKTAQEKEKKLLQMASSEEHAAEAAEMIKEVVKQRTEKASESKKKGKDAPAAGASGASGAVAGAPAAAAAAAAAGLLPDPDKLPPNATAAQRAQAVAAKLMRSKIAAGQYQVPQNPAAGAQRAQQVAARLSGGAAGAAAPSAGSKSVLPAGNHFEERIEINDFPQKVRWRVTQKGALDHVADFTSAAMTTRGVFVEPGRAVPEGEERLYLLIEGKTPQSVHEAKRELMKMLEDLMMGLAPRERVEMASYGKYNVLD